LTTEPQLELPPDPGYPTPAELTTYRVLDQVFDERKRQDAKFGEQNLPWTDRDGRAPWDWLTGIQTEEDIKWLVGAESKRGHLNYSEVLYEEVVEALSATDLAKVREELIQVAASAVAAIESIDRNGR